MRELKEGDRVAVFYVDGFAAEEKIAFGNVAHLEGFVITVKCDDERTRVAHRFQCRLAVVKKRREWWIEREVLQKDGAWLRATHTQPQNPTEWIHVREVKK